MTNKIQKVLCQKQVHYIARSILGVVLPIKRQQLEEFNMWITKNYLPDIIKPVREIEAIKIILIDIKSNFKEQA